MADGRPITRDPFHPRIVLGVADNAGAAEIEAAYFWLFLREIEFPNPGGRALRLARLDAARNALLDDDGLGPAMLTPVACEIDMIDHWPRTLAGMIGSQFAACVDTLKTALANSGVWPDIAFHVNPDSNADDVAWFASHAHRTHRLRVAAIDEFILSVSGASPAHCVIVQQIAPGTRLIVAIPDGMTSLRVEPQPFTDDADDHYTDRDVFLECLFGALCQDPGQVIDVSRIIEHVKVISWRAEAQGYFEHDSCQEHCGSVGAIVMAIEALRGERPE